MRLHSIILLISFFIGFIKSQYILNEISTFLDINCPSLSSSSSSSSDSTSSTSPSLSLLSPLFLSSSSQSIGDDSLNSIDFLNGNSLLESCQSTPSAGAFIKVGICIPNYPAYMYNVSGNNITISYYREDDFNCQNNPVKTLNIINGECYGKCENGVMSTAQFTLVDNPVIPSGVLLNALYTGECNGNYKDSFIFLSYQLLDFCQASTGISSLVSVELSCNSTSSTVRMFSDGGYCSGPSQDFVFPIKNVCGNYNAIQECLN
ncbi:hypothetical protein ACTA71_005481 [Dictyostelium dimigraforme]